MPETLTIHAYAGPQTRVRVASRRRLNVLVTGQGAPPILLLNGLGGTNLGWYRVQKTLSAQTTVVSVDHAGLGFSDPGPLPRSSKAIVEDLRKALQTLKIAPPYIVVGQSAGGLNAQYFAYAHPEEVAGLLFVDPSSAFQGERLFPGGKAYVRGQQKQLRELARLGKAGQLTPDHKLYGQSLWEPNPRLPDAVNDATRAQRTGGANWKTQADELRSFAGLSSEQVVSARRHLGDIPLVVLSAGRMAIDSEGAAPDAIDHWRDMHREIASHSSRGEMRIIDAGHNMHFEDPPQVIEPLQEILALVRR
jgi:pimeloyl-ACP methyl ester carboxylesterase